MNEFVMIIIAYVIALRKNYVDLLFDNDFLFAYFFFTTYVLVMFVFRYLLVRVGGGGVQAAHERRANLWRDSLITTIFFNRQKKHT